jgi:hypothetical protein
MPKLQRFAPGAQGEYFSDALWSGKTVTVHSSTCSHCQALTEFPAMKTMMDHVDICRGCMKLICLNCLGKPCIPAEKRLEHEEAMARLKRRVEMGAWGCY